MKTITRKYIIDRAVQYFYDEFHNNNWTPKTKKDIDLKLNEMINCSYPFKQNIKKVESIFNKLNYNNILDDIIKECVLN